MKFIFLFCILFMCIDLMPQNKTDQRIANTDFCSYMEKDLHLSYPNMQTSVIDGWVYNNIYSDEFNNSELNLNKWIRLDHTYHPNNPHIGYLKENVQLVDGYLVLSAKYDSIDVYSSHNSLPNLWLHFSTGGICSRKNIQYGYYEVECYLPKNHKYQPCFWTIGGDLEYDEVDVFEIINSQNSPYKFCQNAYSNLHDDRSSKTAQYITMSDSITGKTSVFGVEVLPRELVFYLNGNVTSRLVYDPSISNQTNAFTCSDITHTVPMEARLTFSVNVIDGMPQPHEDFVVNYFRCYKLDRGETDTYHPTVFIPSSESSKVYPHVILGGTGCTAGVNSSTAIWAEQDIILDKGFELSAGTAFSARVIQHGNDNPEESPLYNRNCPH